MPLISSPIAYPTSSSPSAAEGPRKKRKVDPLRSPLRTLNSNSRIGGFLVDSSDDEEESLDDLKRKKPSSKPGFGSIIEQPSAPLTDIENEWSNHRKTATYPLDDEAQQSDELGQSMLGGRFAEAEIFTQDKSPAPLPSFDQTSADTDVFLVNTGHGQSIYISERKRAEATSYEQLIAARSGPSEGNARKSYYGIDIHQMMDDIAQEEKIKSLTTSSTIEVQTSIETLSHTRSSKPGKQLMWTEKYRARKFTDLVGDERTHRSVLRWLKGWDSIVFPGSGKAKPKAKMVDGNVVEERAHRKILMLTGPPGLGKTTLAHVCARQAGYEVQEINASDERSSNIVKGRIRDMVATESVRSVESRAENGKASRKASRPSCIIVDEVDGVVGGSGGSGEGGFVKALIDLVLLDQKNSSRNAASQDHGPKRKKKGDSFRLLRPLILICNDVYHPSLRPLRQSSLAEIIHIRKPPFNMVVSRIHSIFEREGVPSDVEAVRSICEATWGVSNRKDAGSSGGTGEGDIRSVMVIGEWVAAKARATTLAGSLVCQRLTRKWVEEQVIGDLGPGGGAARSLGRGGSKDVVDRVFKEGAGFPRTIVDLVQKKAHELEAAGAIGVAEAGKRRAIERLREMIDWSGESERIMTGTVIEILQT